MSINNTQRIIKFTNILITLSEKNVIKYQNYNDSLLKNLSTKTTQIDTLQSLNNKYINENKIIKNQIQKIREKVENAYDFCKDLNRFNKD